MPEFNHTEWKSWAAANGFHRIEAERLSSGKFIIHGIHSAFGPAPLKTRRGEVREFASLDTVSAFLSAAGVARFEVWNPSPENDLFS